ncbi:MULTISPECIES: TetR/AcrR family transcriptional regulator [unclassified Pseudomonas]|uniref:TetR/AcrR family transcriptional regulator n=1 Tax=unclassified Pseudomonas TaxID=196821 RepID=UPI001C434079|nr:MULTISPECIES: TetR/AcrR family transcriptional regulator [unclassified Pseudomonas]
MTDKTTDPHSRAAPPERRIRADAQRNLLILLQAAKEVFAEAGIDAPVRDIADRAGVGIGTVYRHFPKRPDLIAAVFRQEIDACADAAEGLAAEHPPFAALALWMQTFVELASTKRGLAQALHSGDPAFDALPARRDERLWPAFRKLFNAALAAGEIRDSVDADDFLNAAATLCMSVNGTQPGQAERLVTLLVDGLRHGAGRPGSSDSER